MSCLALILIHSTLLADPAIDAAQFSRLTRGLLSVVRDVTLIYEGRKYWTKNPDKVINYQCYYAFRSDGATLLDVFARSSEVNHPLYRQFDVVFNKKLTSMQFMQDQGVSEPRISGGGPGVLNSPQSAERFLYYWYLLTLTDPENYGYEFQGWEKVDGHRCLRVQLSVIPKKDWPKGPGDNHFIRLWIDVERGGNPLKVEFLDGSNVSMRSDHIRLGQVPFPDGKLIWFPLSGETNSFKVPVKTGGFSYQTAPVAHETYAVVDGSVIFNQNLSDDAFSIKRKDHPYGNADLSQRRAELEKVLAAPPLRTDPASVKKRLDLLLAEADSQAKRLVASADASEPWPTTRIFQITLAAVSGLILIAATFLKWRSR